MDVFDRMAEMRRNGEKDRRPGRTKEDIRLCRTKKHRRPGRTEKDIRPCRTKQDRRPVERRKTEDHA